MKNANSIESTGKRTSSPLLFQFPKSQSSKKLILIVWWVVLQAFCFSQHTHTHTHTHTFFKNTRGVPWWLTELRIQPCQWCGKGSIPGQATSTCCKHSQKKTTQTKLYNKYCFTTFFKLTLYQNIFPYWYM